MKRDFDTVASAIEAVREGRPVVIVDDEDRENEGDVVLPAQYVTPKQVNFMVTHARGLVCVALPPEDVERLEIPMMADIARDPGGRANVSPFTVSVEAAAGVSTGISAHDRARTIAALADPGSTAADLVMPGHVFPLRGHPRGLAARRGHTEASLALMRLAGIRPAAVICEIMNDDGTMARRGALGQFAAKHALPIITISDLALAEEAAPGEHAVIPLPGVEHESSAPRRSGNQRARGKLTEFASLPTRFGQFRTASYVDDSGLEHLVLARDDVRLGHAQQDLDAVPLVRVHSECLTGDALGSLRCDCGDQLDLALKRLGREPDGLLLYLRQEGRGIGLANKIRAYTLQDDGLDTVEANVCLGFLPDERDYSVAAEILRCLSVRRVRLLTNNPDKIGSLEANGIAVEERVPLSVSRAQNTAYLRTKAEKLQHLI